MKKSGRFFACLITLQMLFSLAGCANASGETEVVVLKIGQADAIVLLSAGKAVLIDSGEKEDGEEILRFLFSRGIDSLDLMIITHYDKDHVGGADTVLSGIPVRAVYDAGYEPDTKRYRAYTEAIQAAGAPRYRVSSEVTLSVGGLSLALKPTALRDATDNNQSLVVVVEDAWRRFFFAADAEEARISELLQSGIQKASVVKMPHHGKYHTNFPEFLEALGAEIAVITDSEKNPAWAETLSLLREMDTKAYQTKDGNVYIISGEGGLTVRQGE